jgi:hypothetical protein
MGEDTKMTDKATRELEEKRPRRRDTGIVCLLSESSGKAPGSSWAVGSSIKIRCFIPTRTLLK